MPSIFNGRTLISPQVSSFIDDTALTATGIAASSTLAIVGIATGGKPNTALAFTASTDAVALLRSGDLLDCVRRAFAPGAGNPGAAKVIAVRIQNATTPALRSTLTLNDLSAVAAVALTSADYGAWNNQIRVQVAAGTTRGLKLTTAAPVSGTIQNVINDNIYRALVSVQYVGAAATSAATVTASQIQFVNAGGVDNQTITFAANPTIQTIVDTLNSTGKYVAAVLGLGTEASNTLDGQTSVDVKTAPFTFTATLQAFIDTVNAGSLMTAARSTSLLAPAATPFTYLTGGTDGAAPTNADWTTGLAVLEPEQVGIACVASGSATVHAALQAHVDAMSLAKRERIAIVGGVTGETNAQAVTRATNIGDDRVAVVYPGLNDNDPISGVLTAYHPFVTAAAVAGILAGGKINQAATYRYIGAQSMELRLKDSDVDTLLTGGVIPVQNIAGKGNRIVQSVSTNTVTKNLLHNEISVRRNADVVAATIRDTCEPLVATTTGPDLVGLVFSNCQTALTALVQQGLLISFSNIKVTISGTTVNVQFSAAIGVPANWITIVAHLSPFTS